MSERKKGFDVTFMSTEPGVEFTPQKICIPAGDASTHSVKIKISERPLDKDYHYLEPSVTGVDSVSDKIERYLSAQRIQGNKMLDARPAARTLDAPNPFDEAWKVRLCFTGAASMVVTMEESAKSTDDLSPYLDKSTIKRLRDDRQTPLNVKFSPMDAHVVGFLHAFPNK